VATLRDVAQLAGVSITTVSHALNGTRFVQPETAARVFSAVRQLGYLPNPAARSLRTRSSRTIGVIGPSAVDWFFLEAFTGIEETCYARGYEVYLGFVERGLPFARPRPDRSKEQEFTRAILSGRFDAPYMDESQEIPGSEKEQKLMSKLLARCVDGLILNVWQPDEVIAATLHDASAEIALFHRRVAGVRGDLFGSEEYSGTLAAMEAFLSQGHRRIAMVYSPSQPGHGVRQRFRAYHDALQNAGLPLDAGLLIDGGYYLETAAEATRAVLSVPDPPTAILFWGDPLAVAGMEAARETGRSIPSDLSVIGFDDMPMAGWVSPRLSTVRQERLGLGAAMAARLIDRIEGRYEGPPEEVLLPTSFVARDSVARAPTPSVP
jgi:LacI family transcriptional regulator